MQVKHWWERERVWKDVLNREFLEEKKTKDVARNDEDFIPRHTKKLQFCLCLASFFWGVAFWQIWRSLNRKVRRKFLIGFVPSYNLHNNYRPTYPGRYNMILCKLNSGSQVLRLKRRQWAEQWNNFKTLNIKKYFLVALILSLTFNIGVGHCEWTTSLIFLLSRNVTLFGYNSFTKAKSLPTDFNIAAVVVAQLVEQLLPTLDVRSSNPVISKKL